MGYGASAVGGAVYGEVVHENGGAVDGALDVDLDGVGAEAKGGADAGQGVLGSVAGAGRVGDDQQPALSLSKGSALSPAEGSKGWHIAIIRQEASGGSYTGSLVAEKMMSISRRLAATSMARSRAVRASSKRWGEVENSVFRLT